MDRHLVYNVSLPKPVLHLYVLHMDSVDYLNSTSYAQFLVMFFLDQSAYNYGIIARSWLKLQIRQSFSGIDRTQGMEEVTR